MDYIWVFIAVVVASQFAEIVKLIGPGWTVGMIGILCLTMLVERISRRIISKNLENSS